MTTQSFEYGQFYSARFEPVHRDTLKPGALEMIGQEFVFEAVWVIEEGTYEGQRAMQFVSWGDQARRWEWDKLDFWWVPEEDLANMVSVPALPRYADIVKGNA